MNDVVTLRREAIALGLRPPPRLSLSAWANEHFRLSSESAAHAGRWTSLPYQTGIMDAITDPHVTRVSLMKSARIGYTLMVSAAVGYYIHQAPCPILLVQPTVEDGKGFSKETIAPMLRDVPALAEIVFENDDGPKGSNNTIQHKRFPGGVLSIVGANSGAGFRRVSRKVVVFDEVDAYPSSAGSDGDPIELGTKRTEYYWDRKILAGSTPLVAGTSRIEALFEEGDQRRFYVPCPQCGAMDFLTFRETDQAGHFMVFDEAHPEGAHFVCRANGCVIEHSQKREMIARGEWRAARPFAGHASFHIWAAYSYSPNSSWGDIAAEFLKAKKKAETLRVFVNTVLGQTWREAGEAPEWEHLYARREMYEIGTVPDGVRWLTCGVDVQKDRCVYEVVGWGPGKESWSIDAGVIPMNTSDLAHWSRIDELLGRVYDTPAGPLAIMMLAVDSGYNTQTVYNWVRAHERTRVIAVKGVSTARTLVGSPTPVDVHWNGKKISRGVKVWPVSPDVAKAEFYGFLKLQIPEPGTPYPSGFVHFPQHGPDYFKQITAEHLVLTVDRKGYRKTEWQLIPGRENHWLDARNYARAGAAVLGLDRARPKEITPVEAHALAASVAPAVVVQTPPQLAPAAPPVVRVKSDSRFLGRRGKPWL